MEQRANRLAPAAEPRDWGYTDEELARSRPSSDRTC